MRERVARACLELLAEGHGDFGPLDVARRSGVSRATVYRWWPTKADLLKEALEAHTRQLRISDSGDWGDDLRAVVASFAKFFEDPIEVSQNALMASGAYPEYNAAVLEHYESIFATWRELFERARERGEVRADVDADATLLVAGSALLLVPLLFRRKVTRRELDQIVEIVWRGTCSEG